MGTSICVQLWQFGFGTIPLMCVFGGHLCGDEVQLYKISFLERVHSI